MKRLIFDAEVSPNTCLVWKTGNKISVNPEAIIEERQIISIAWKWHGKSKIYDLTWDKNRDDKKLLQNFIPVLNESDEAVAYFGKSYDKRFVLTRALIQGVPFNSEVKIVDPLEWVRNRFLFNSGKLNYVSQVLGVGEKIHTDFQLWKDIVLRNCPIALAKMCKYNRHDVKILEGVFDKIAPLVPSQTHLGVLLGGEKWSCPTCASTIAKTSKTRTTATGVVKYQMQCENGHYYTISERVHSDYLKR
jgi:hypothetical protein